MKASEFDNQLLQEIVLILKKSCFFSDKDT